jgi:CBS domain-containing membrane protein
MSPWKAWLRGFVPAPLILGWRERVLGCIGAGLGLLGTEAISRLALGDAAPWFLVPMGASAVLLFAVPASPLAQPWSIVGGNVVAALVGVAFAQLVPDREIAAALAGSVAIAVMFSLRCLHPPSGAVALTAVLGGPEVHALGYGFVVAPVLLNSLLLLALALVFNNLLRHRYPHAAAPAGAPVPLVTQPPVVPGFSHEDLAAVLREHDELLDISEDDLEDILRRVEQRAFSRATNPQMNSPAPVSCNGSQRPKPTETCAKPPCPTN